MSVSSRVYGAAKQLLSARSAAPALLLAAALAGGAAVPAEAQQNGSAQSQAIGGQTGFSQPILLQADEFIFDAENRVWRAIGNVEADQQGRILQADELYYDEGSGIVSARGNVRIIEPTGEMLTADEIRLTSDFRDGVIRSLGFLLGENGRLAAARAVRRDGQVTTMNRAVFSTCRVCEGDGSPLWQMKATEVIHDQEQREIIYRNARLEVYGVPIAWAPYFAHPDPTVDRKSGFLAPSFGNSSELGNILEIPYYFVLRPNMDLTLAPMLTTRGGIVAKGEFRHRTGNGQYEFSGSITNVSREETATPGSGFGRTTRSHLFGNGRFALTPKIRAGFDVQLTSDDTYLRRYEISEEDRLTSRAYAERFDGRDYSAYNAYYFKGLRAEDDEGLTPYVPLSVEHTSVFYEPVTGGQVDLSLSGLSLIRGEGRDTQRVAVSGTWKRTLQSSFGDRLTAFADVRGDAYYVTDIDTDGIPGGETNTELQGRVLPTTGVDWRLPFVRGRASARQIIEPIVQVIYAPYGGNPDEIPNEDSASFEFDETNLFSLNKFPGLDRWESGPRANVGLRMAAIGQTYAASFLIGQTYRLKRDDAFVQGSGLEERNSDFVGRITLQAGEALNLTHRFRLDRDSLTFRRNEVDLDLRTGRYELRAGYLSLGDELQAAGLEAREELRLEGRARVLDNWSVAAGARRDFEDDEMISSNLSLIFSNECTEFEAAFRRRFTRDRDIEPSSSLIFRIRLLGGGR